MRTKIISILLVLLSFAGLAHSAGAFWFDYRENVFETGGDNLKEVVLLDNGLVFNTSTRAKTVGDFIKEQDVDLEDSDLVIPGKNGKIYSGSRIVIQRLKEITLAVEGKEMGKQTFLENVEQVLWENNISLGENDIVLPSKLAPVAKEMGIQVIRVVLKEEIEHEDIDYDTVTQEDGELGWRIKKVAQKGVEGILEKKYSVAYHDSQEVSRKLIEKNVIKDPVTEITVQGTYVKVGKSHTGLASWYSYTGELCAASPWLPMGSYARVTNRDNGKSVIVKINDRGPFSTGKIIDLDSVAFQKLAPLGQGVANVRVEEILN